MFDGDEVDEESVKVIVAVCEMPGAEVGQGHEEHDGEKEGDIKAEEAVAHKGARSFACDGRQYEDAADEEHKGHEEDVVEVFEDIEAISAHGVDNGVGRGVIGLFVKAGKGGIGKGGMMRHDQHCDECTKIVEPERRAWGFAISKYSVLGIERALGAKVTLVRDHPVEGRILSLRLRMNCQMMAGEKSMPIER